VAKSGFHFMMAKKQQLIPLLAIILEVQLMSTLAASVQKSDSMIEVDASSKMMRREGVEVLMEAKPKRAKELDTCNVDYILGYEGSADCTATLGGDDWSQILDESVCRNAERFADLKELMQEKFYLPSEDEEEWHIVNEHPKGCFQAECPPEVPPPKSGSAAGWYDSRYDKGGGGNKGGAGNQTTAEALGLNASLLQVPGNASTGAPKKCYYFNNVEPQPDCREKKTCGGEPVCTRARFVWGSNDTEANDGCPDGYEGVLDMDVCENAAACLEHCIGTSLGRDFEIGRTNSSMFLDYPKGCFKENKAFPSCEEGTVFFNPGNERMGLGKAPKGSALCRVKAVKDRAAVQARPEAGAPAAEDANATTKAAGNATTGANTTGTASAAANATSL